MLAASTAHSFQNDPKKIDGIYSSVVRHDLSECESTADKPFCARLFAYIGALDPRDPAVQKNPPPLSALMSGAIVMQFQPLWTTLCTRDTLECRLLRGTLEGAKPNQDVCADMPAAPKALCRELRDYQAGRCPVVTEPFLRSACDKKTNAACKSDLACAIAMSRLSGNHDAATPEMTAALKAAAEKMMALKRKLISEAVPLLASVPKSTPTNDMRLPGPSGFPLLRLEPPASRSARLALKTKSSPVAAAQPALAKPTFTMVQTFKWVLPSTDLESLFPWNMAQGMAAADITGDGRMDLVLAHGRKLLFFENKGRNFAKYEVDLSPILQGFALTDVSVADLKGLGSPQIIVQQFPGDLLLLSWDWTKTSFGVESIQLPIHGITHVIAKSSSGDPRLFVSGRMAKGNAILDAEASAVVDFDGPKPTATLIQQQAQGKSTSLALLPEKGAPDSLVAARGYNGASEFFRTSDFKTVPDLSLPIFGASIGRLNATDGSQITLFANSTLSTPVKSPRPFFMNRPKKPEDCVSQWRDKNACLIHYASRIARPERELCSLLKEPLLVSVCEEQVNGFELGIRVTLPPKYGWGHVAYSSVSPLKYDPEWTRALYQVGQIRHIAPVAYSSHMQGFLVSEVDHSNAEARRLLWIAKHGKEVKVTDLNSSLPKGEPFDGINFAVADFDGDGHPDLAYRSGIDFVFLKGYWGPGANEFEEVTTQMGRLSRTLSPVPARTSRKTSVAPEKK